MALCKVGASPTYQAYHRRVNLGSPTHCPPWLQDIDFNGVADIDQILPRAATPTYLDSFCVSPLKIVL